jgi:hypothetical protein
VPRPLLWAADGQPAEPLLNRLDPVLRTQVLMALLGLLLLGLLLVLVVLVGARYARRLARHRPAAAPPAQDDWCRKPLNQQAESELTDE